MAALLRTLRTAAPRIQIAAPRIAAFHTTQKRAILPVGPRTHSRPPRALHRL